MVQCINVLVLKKGKQFAFIHYKIFNVFFLRQNHKAEHGVQINKWLIVMTWPSGGRLPYSCQRFYKEALSDAQH